LSDGQVYAPACGVPRQKISNSTETQRQPQPQRNRNRNRNRNPRTTTTKNGYKKQLQETAIRNRAIAVEQYQKQ